MFSPLQSAIAVSDGWMVFNSTTFGMLADLIVKSNIF